MKQRMSQKAKRRLLVERVTLTPYSLWAVVFILVPLAFVAYYAFTDNEFNFTFSPRPPRSSGKTVRSGRSISIC